MGVSGGDVATPNLILGGINVEAIVTDYRGNCLEEGGTGSSNELVVGSQEYISAWRRDTLEDQQEIG